MDSSEGRVAMTVKERIHMIRLMEKLRMYPECADKFGILIENK